MGDTNQMQEPVLTGGLFEMRRTIFFAALISASVAAEEYAGYSLAGAEAFRKQWTIDNWDDGGHLMRYVFLNMPEFWNHSVISRGAGPVRELPDAFRQEVADFVADTELGDMSLFDYVHKANVNGAIVLHRGEIVFEEYPRMLPQDKHLTMSVSKPFAATLIAQLEDRGRIDVSRPVDDYLPELEGSGWEGVSVLDVLDMASGIACLEETDGAYSDPRHCYYQYEASLGWLRQTLNTMDSPYEYFESMVAHRPPGEAFEYTSPDTFVLARIAERITDRPYAFQVATEIWQHMGAEADALIAAPKNGIPIAHGGISATLRDVARFGLLFTPSGSVGGNGVVSDAYLEKIQQGGRPEIFNVAVDPEDHLIDGEPALHNSYQWDIVMEDGDFYKSGYGGQGLYISPSRDLVIAFFGTWMESEGDQHEMKHVVRQLATSGQFPD